MKAIPMIIFSSSEYKTTLSVHQISASEGLFCFRECKKAVPEWLFGITERKFPIPEWLFCYREELPGIPEE
ncbi:MAG: hypothetical protein ACREO7_05390 [Pseudoxanthomonas sp.]